MVKADDGSRGMGIVTVRDARSVAEVAQTLERAAPGAGPQDMLVQEGVVTRERINDAVAEPVVYMMDRYVVGGFYRIHADRGEDEDLCAPKTRVDSSHSRITQLRIHQFRITPQGNYHHE